MAVPVSGGEVALEVPVVSRAAHRSFWRACSLLRTISERPQRASATAREETAAPPCFFSRVCRGRAAIEKSGRSVCRECANTRVRGHEYPLRDPSAEPLYLTGRVASEALDMVEEAPLAARRRLRGSLWS